MTSNATHQAAKTTNIFLWVSVIQSCIMVGLALYFSLQLETNPAEVLASVESLRTELKLESRKQSNLIVKIQSDLATQASAIKEMQLRLEALK